jgi:hypothetical protein
MVRDEGHRAGSARSGRCGAGGGIRETLWDIVAQPPRALYGRDGLAQGAARRKGGFFVHQRSPTWADSDSANYRSGNGAVTCGFACAALRRCRWQVGRGRPFVRPRCPLCALEPFLFALWSFRLCSRCTARFSLTLTAYALLPAYNAYRRPISYLTGDGTTTRRVMPAIRSNSTGYLVSNILNWCIDNAVRMSVQWQL